MLSSSPLFCPVQPSLQSTIIAELYIFFPVYVAFFFFFLSLFIADTIVTVGGEQQDKCDRTWEVRRPDVPPPPSLNHLLNKSLAFVLVLCQQHLQEA